MKKQWLIAYCIGCKRIKSVQPFDALEPEKAKLFIKTIRRGNRTRTKDNVQHWKVGIRSSEIAPVEQDCPCVRRYW